MPCPTTAIPLNTSLWLAPEQFGEAARAIHGSGVVDRLFVWDQLTHIWPPHMWNPENAPMAAALPDLDSYGEAFALAAYALACAPGAGVVVSTDAIRRGPAELNQMMWTLSQMARGHATLQLGAGEIKQTRPFGWKRSEGLARLEDQLRLAREFWNSADPVEYTGKHWTMKRAWLGKWRGARPEIWALGGGPKLLDLATSHADGFAAIARSVFTTPEEFADGVRKLKEDLERKGRDPEKFGFGLWFMNAIHEDRDVLDRAFDGAFLKWLAAVFGRLHQPDWRKLGLEPPFPDDWHYAMKLRPVDVTEDEAAAVVAQVTRRHCEAGYSHGTPQEIADEVQAYVDAGCTYVAICDLLPLVLEPEDAQAALPRSIEVCRLIKERNG